MIREAILAEMKKRDWTPYRLAQESGVTQSRVYEFLTSERHIRTDSADRILAALNLQVLPGKSRKKA